MVESNPQTKHIIRHKCSNKSKRRAYVPFIALCLAVAIFFWSTSFHPEKYHIYKYRKLSEIERDLKYKSTECFRAVDMLHEIKSDVESMRKRLDKMDDSEKDSNSTYNTSTETSEYNHTHIIKNHTQERIDGNKTRVHQNKTQSRN